MPGDRDLPGGQRYRPAPVRDMRVREYRRPPVRQSCVPRACARKAQGSDRVLPEGDKRLSAAPARDGWAGPRDAATLARVRVRMARGEHRTVAVALNRTGRRLLAARHRVAAKLTVSGTVIGVIESTLAQQKVLLGTSSRGARTAHAAARARGRARARGISSRRRRTWAGTPTSRWAGGYSEQDPAAGESSCSTAAWRPGLPLIWLDAGWWQGKRDASGEITRQRRAVAARHRVARTHAARSGLPARPLHRRRPDGCGGLAGHATATTSRTSTRSPPGALTRSRSTSAAARKQGSTPPPVRRRFHAAIAGQRRATARCCSTICNFLQPGQQGPTANRRFANPRSPPTLSAPAVGNSWRTDTDVGVPGNVSVQQRAAQHRRRRDRSRRRPARATGTTPTTSPPTRACTRAQFRSQFSMWAMLAAPLMISDDLPTISEPSLSALVNKRGASRSTRTPPGVQGGRSSRPPATARCGSSRSSDGSYAVALLNRGSSAAHLPDAAPLLSGWDPRLTISCATCGHTRRPGPVAASSQRCQQAGPSCCACSLGSTRRSAARRETMFSIGRCAGRERA